jgi:hypothetical protein
LFDWIAVLLCKGGDGWLKKKGGGGDVTIRWVIASYKPVRKIKNR